MIHIRSFYMANAIHHLFLFRCISCCLFWQFDCVGEKIYHTIGVHIFHFHQISRNIVMHSDDCGCIKHEIFHCDLEMEKKT